MPNERIKLRDVVVSRLKGAKIPNIGDSIYQWKLQDTDKEDGDVILVYTPEEDADIHSESTSQYKRTTNLLIEIRARSSEDGKKLFDRLDLYCQAVEIILLEDRFLGTFDSKDFCVTDTLLTGTDMDSDKEGEEYIAHAKMSFSVKYFTSEAITTDKLNALERIFSTIEIDGNDKAVDHTELAQ